MVPVILKYISLILFLTYIIILDYFLVSDTLRLEKKKSPVQKVYILCVEGCVWIISTINLFEGVYFMSNIPIPCSQGYFLIVDFVKASWLEHLIQHSYKPPHICTIIFPLYTIILSQILVNTPV